MWMEFDDEDISRTPKEAVITDGAPTRPCHRITTTSASSLSTRAAARTAYHAPLQRADQLTRVLHPVCVFSKAAN
jgi:hypothetical protein